MIERKFEMESINSGIKLDTILVGNIAGKFNIPSYQRGYRWGVDEVTRLLDDIYSNGSKPYCLQPVVVQKKNDKYELIDGQQRLTTLFILLQYIKRESNLPIVTQYKLSYDTRKNSEQYLADIKEDEAEKNIDYFHICQAYKTIDKWFKECENSVVAAYDIYSYLTKYVKIIWYEIPSDSKDAIGLFTRLNIGKIPLTSAELVKAMFLTETNLDVNGKNTELKQKLHEAKQNEISTQWDIIEKELHNESLWKFLTNNGNSRYKTRIDLVLDLIADKPSDSRDKYYTFFYFDSLRKEKELNKVWQEIQHTFLLLKDWYEDHDLYHKIGYLIASEYKDGTLVDIFKLSNGKTKKEFKNQLDDLIRESIKIKSNYADLDYNSSQDREKITRLLLLFNVESVYQIDGKTQRFPFNQYKSFTSGKVLWSLEHIHAQHSEGLKTQEQWKLWLEKHIGSVRAVANDKIDLLNEIQEAIDKPKLIGDEFDRIHQKVVEVLSEKGEISIHSIANLTLLNTADNAALSNATFDVKRNEIIRMDKAGQYIPFCTKMVFLKYYTPSESNQLHFWGIEDRIAYVENINSILSKYLYEKIYTDDKASSIETEGDEQ